MLKLKAYLKTLSNKKKLDAFAREYYGIKLDARANRDDMLALFFSVLEKDEKVPLKTLPYEDEVVEEEVVIELVSEKEIKIQVAEDLAMLEDAHAENEAFDIEAKELADIIAAEAKVDSDEGLKDLEELEETPLDDVTYIQEKPCFELNFLNGPDRYQMIQYTVTDYLDKIKNGAYANDAPSSILAQVLTVMHYVELNGKIMLRETRNSRFLTYTTTDLGL